MCENKRCVFRTKSCSYPDGYPRNRCDAKLWPARFEQDVVDVSADGVDVASTGLEAGHFKPWPHDASGNSLSG